ncbi:putative damage-inducible protein DinB [Halopolyspora algeriensis]|uniref:Putative damage-inducible protein DinB n=1 Tax=Halopolyspora algeriensis TaxID=1500506 RepID=A0A368VHU4_9ACTN|nr:DinB family protein [Halopolyspora algeriensis]RCW40828.1 putative damage-inducible protein DinB [Halopolyspora algeriensis]TQM53254.1 putative damage-inducible protein DinB [Halopolyspora algeriensis]
MQERPQSVPVPIDDPDVTDFDSQELLLKYLDWYRDALSRKIADLSEEQLRAPVEPLGWAPLGLVRHLGWVERRWMRWGFAAEDVLPCLPGGDEVEWSVAGESTSSVLAAYFDEVERSRSLAARAGLADSARLGGRFTEPGQAPCLGQILFHLLQEYARHVGQLDVARELIDGVTGE